MPKFIVTTGVKKDLWLKVTDLEVEIPEITDEIRKKYGLETEEDIYNYLTDELYDAVFVLAEKENLWVIEDQEWGDFYDFDFEEV